MRASCCESRSQVQNKNQAFWKLIRALSEHFWVEKEKLDRENDKGLDNSVIRTYNEKRNEIKDERLPDKYKVSDILYKNSLEDLLKDLKFAEKNNGYNG